MKRTDPVKMFMEADRRRGKGLKVNGWRTGQRGMASHQEAARAKRREIREANLAALKARQAFYDTGIRHEPTASLLDGAT